MLVISTAWIGTAGILAIEGSYLPQIVRLYRLKRAEEVSLLFPALNLGGRLLALTYSLLMHDRVFTAGFLVGAVLRLTLLVEVAWYRRAAAKTDSSAPPPATMLREHLAR